MSEMFNVGAGEMIFILVAALLILGPKRLPEMMRVIGKFMREFRRQTDDVRGLVEREFYKMDEEIVRPLEADKPPTSLAPGVEPPPPVEDPADPSLHPDHPDHFKDDNPPIHIPPQASSPIPPESAEHSNGAASEEPPPPVPQAVPTAVSRERAREKAAAVENAGASGEKKVVN